MIPAPKNYSDWINLFEQIKNHENDEEVVAAMERGTIPWQAGVAERFTSKMVETVNKRLDDAADRFKRNMSHSTGEQSLFQALNTMRKDLALMKRIVSIKAIPADIREKYIAMVTKYADEAQHSLEDSAKSDRTGKLRFLIRNHPVNRI
jgi:hypothetical protein